MLGAEASQCRVTVKITGSELEYSGLKPHSISFHWQYDFG